ncbi:hypothetical protein REPUB_Repub03eG0221200 [Reevesia pubescens]
MEKDEQSQACPHVLVFPLPIQGHINSMVKLAELLALTGFKVTFLNSEHNHERLIKYTNITDHFARYPGFEFKTIPDGLPDDHPRSGNWFLEMFDAMEMKTKPSLRKILLKISPPVDCIIEDGFLGFALDVAKEFGIPNIYFRTSSPNSFWAYYSIPDIIEAGELPIRGSEDMDRLITTVPGMETFLRCRDLPNFCRASDMTDSMIQLVVKQTRKSPQAHALMLNTFEDLDGPILSQIRTKCPNLHAIGPIHAQLNTRLKAKYGESSDHVSNSLWEVDRSCISWLDKQPKQSVIYVSFGSITVTLKEQLIELWYGLVNSKKRFLWVVRPNSVTGKGGQGEDVPVELSEGTKERGYIVGWAPQEEVLNHPAIGGFLTHSGWNSTLESVVAGVPMICWPYFADQQVNSRFVSEVWKIGLDMKDVCDRKVVEKMVNDLMVDKREEFVKSVAKMAKLANESVHLLHPISQAQLNLPKLTTIRSSIGLPVDADSFHFIHKCIQLKPPKDEFLVMVIFAPKRCLAFAKSGYVQWKTVVGVNDIKDLVLFKGQIHSICGRGRLLRFESDNPESVTKIIARYPPDDVIKVDKIYLVESSGELLAVFRNGSSNPFKTKSFMVYMLQFDINGEKGILKRLNGLGDYALFVGEGNSWSISMTNILNCKGNRIYFTDDNWEQHVGLDIGAFDMVNKKIES